MVWGCMSAAGTGELQFIEGTMNANMYCKHTPAPWCRHGGVEEDSSGNLWSSGELHAQEG